MNTPNKSLALRYSEFGDPYDVLSLEEIDLPAPEPDFVTLSIIAAPINPADFGRISGTYGKLATLPATGGLEGVAEIVATGENASRFKTGDRVLFSAEPGSWQTYANARESQLYLAPPSLDDEQAAMFWVNPATAWRLIHDFAKLEPGDWVIQNAATSAVGKLVIQFASHLGIKTVNLVRNPKSAQRLLELGATQIIQDDRDAAQAIADIMGKQKAKLGLNAVGGSSALTISKHLANGCTLVTYGGMDREPAPFPTRHLIFNDLRLRGFWVNQWYRNASRETIEAMHEEIAQLMKTANISTEVAATYPLKDWRTALKHSFLPGKIGKALFKM